jgi:hypothetical protein
MKLKVVYDGKPNYGLDKSLDTFFKNLGFEWWAEGWSKEKNERDICYERVETKRKK